MYQREEHVGKTNHIRSILEKMANKINKILQIKKTHTKTLVTNTELLYDC